MYSVIEQQQKSIILNPLEAEHPSPGVSDRYKFISTKDIISTFNEQGFEVSSVQYPKARKDSKVGYNSHLVRMRQVGVSSFLTEVPEVLIINSHDGTKAFRLGLGFFRFVCSNGLIVGDFMADSGRITHKGQISDNILSYISSFSKNVSDKVLKITDMKQCILSSSELESFEFQASQIINPSVFEPHDLLSIKRTEDKQATVWNAFNVVQENATHGTYRINGSTKVRKARPIKDITRTVDINTKLWKLAESYVS